MKKVFGLLVLIMTVQHAFAQKDSLQVDENNNYVYYKVVEKANLPADTVYERAFNFAKTLSKENKPAKGQADKAFNISSKFITYGGMSLVRKESGEVKYTLNFQAADGKYRYNLSNFVFIPYKRDRYGNMTAVPGVEVAVEKFAAKYSQKEKDAVLDQIAAQSLAIEARLKQAIDRTKVPVKQIEVKKVNTGNW
ncbi:DUF4468 domain-containing protein [Mucilaginibacter conchicola]|uniref:DUF4468 domain-containing protein n=1 Tax=Mucilaginibacter conchicola TaxID=2303333 RepID=A0A372NXC1_9SPHI|nr:DUF4468 domain-containing protein [Mucilaginibacter conchicola]RFZ94544.1 DUF4468 domain-containing protein [Mucilaginibacter conchicola]